MSAWSLPMLAPLQHGGPNGAGVARFDFSTNANAAGPLAAVAAAVAAVDRTRYPDPGYRLLREQLAAWHGVSPQRIVIAGSASEFIHRFTQLAARSRRVRRAVVPHPGYGEYAAAAHVAGLEVVAHGSQRPRAPTADDLWWITEPSSPDGGTLGDALGRLIGRADEAGAVVVLDLAYQPLRLDARALPSGCEPAWQLWSPNKSCGLPGVRAAYAIAPASGEPVAHALQASAPSWVAGTEGVAMLSAFAAEPAWAELATQRRTLQAWRDTLSRGLQDAGWHMCESQSVVPFFIAQPPAGLSMAGLRERGIQLRDTTSMGLRGWVRLSAQPPEAIDALLRTLAAP
jgi:histidinol-phosphate aminotransferase